MIVEDRYIPSTETVKFISYHKKGLSNTMV